MADGFAFEIVGDAGKANKAIDGVLAGLDKIPTAAKRVGGELGNAFDHAETVIRKHNQALESGAPLKYTQELMRAAEASRAHVEQLQREAQMLQQLRGPAQQAAQDIQTLNALLGKGAINAQEFNEKLAAIRPPSNFQRGAGGPTTAGGGFDVAGSLGGLPGGSLIAGAVGGGVAGLANAGLQMAVQGAGQIVEMADAYTSLNNRLVALTGSQSKATELFDKLHTSADKTRSDINTTASSFVQFSRATRDLGVSQDQVIKFTEHLNEAIALSGADSAAAQAGLLQLSQAMASGALRGQDLHSVMEQIPIVAQTIQDHLHVTAGKFKEMADNGQITAKVVLDAFNEMGPKLEQQFGNSVPTIGQQYQVFKNDVSVVVGQLMQSINASGAAGDAVKILGAIVKSAADDFKHLNEALGVVGLQMSDLTAGSATGFATVVNSVVDTFHEMDFSVDGFKRALSGTPPVQSRFVDAQTVINRTVAEGTGHLRDYDLEQIEVALQMAMGADASRVFAEATKSISEKAQQAHEATKAWGEVVGDLTTGLDVASLQLGKLGQVIADSPFVRSLGLGQKQADSFREARIELKALTEAHQQGAVIGKNYQSQYEALMTTLNNGQLPATIRMWHQLHDPIETFHQDTAALDILLRAGTITFEQYERATRKAGEAFQMLSDEGELLHSIHGAQEQIEVDFQTLELLYAKGKISLGEYNFELQKRNDLLVQIRLNELQGFGGVHSMPTAGLGQKAGGMEQEFSANYLGSLVGASMSKQQGNSLTNLWKAQLEQIHADNERYAQLIAKAWAPVEDAIKNAALTGKIEWADFAKSMEQALVEIAMQLLKTAALTALLGPGGNGTGALGFQGSLGTALFSALGGGRDGFDYLAGNSGLQLPGFAGGGSVTRTSGGPEPLLAMWWMSPNESIHVRTEQQRREASEAAGGGGNVTVVPEVKVLLPRDRRAIVDDTRSGMTTLVKMTSQLDRNRR